jgi:hypothetical protein
MGRIDRYNKFMRPETIIEPDQQWMKGMAGLT